MSYHMSDLRKSNLVIQPHQLEANMFPGKAKVDSPCVRGRFLNHSPVFYHLQSVRLPDLADML